MSDPVHLRQASVAEAGAIAIVKLTFHRQKFRPITLAKCQSSDKYLPESMIFRIYELFINDLPTRNRSKKSFSYSAKMLE